MKLEIELEKVNFKNCIKEMKINGVKVGNGITKMLIDMDGMNGVKVYAFTTESSLKNNFIDESLLKNNFVEFYVENEREEK
jgi:hypothetical protein